MKRTVFADETDEHIHVSSFVALRPTVRRILSIGVSVLAFGLALSFSDLSAFNGLASRANWSLLPLVGVLVVAISIAFGWRWNTLLRESIKLPRSLLISVLGLAGNQVLPLRGGDAMRVVLSSRGSGMPSLHASVSAVALEKLFDLIAVAMFGLLSAATLMRVGRDSEVHALVVAVTILLATVGFLSAARLGWLGSLLRQFARGVGMNPRLYRHVFAPLHHLRKSVSPSRMALLLLETGTIWIGLYVAAYLAIARLVGVSLDVSEAMAILFGAAIGLAIPAAPSGVGTFHAAVVSTFALLGRSPSEGFVLAVAIHGIFFLGFCALGAMVMPLAIRVLGPLSTREERA